MQRSVSTKKYAFRQENKMVTLLAIVKSSIHNESCTQLSKCILKMITMLQKLYEPPYCSPNYFGTSTTGNEGYADNRRKRELVLIIQLVLI